jgi:hypothetical protein
MFHFRNYKTDLGKFWYRGGGGGGFKKNFKDKFYFCHIPTIKKKKVKKLMGF